MIEEYAAGRVVRSVPPSAASTLFVLSARTADQLREHAQRMLAWLRLQRSPDVEALTYTLQVAREAMEHRFACRFDGMADLIRKLGAFVAGERHIDEGYRGEVKRNREALGAFTADEDLQRAIEAWIAKGKHDKLLDLWVKGLIVDWKSMRAASIPPRVSLPTYPFAPERHWVSTQPVAASAAPASNADEAPQTMLLTPQWEPAPSVSAAPVAGEHWVLFAGWPDAVSADAWPSARVETLSDPGGDKAERIGDFGLQLLQRVQSWLHGKPRTPLLVQVVIPAGEETLYALAGLLKTARLEQPLLRGQVIGVEAVADARLLASQLVHCATSDAAELRCTGTARHERRYRPLRVSGAAGHPWKRDGVYLITGGGGGLGRLVAEAIGRDVGTATVVLVGRSAPRDLPQSAGLTVDYQCADVSDAAAVEQLVAAILARYGRLDGIVHSAGVIRDGFLLRKSEAQYREVMAPKVNGVVNLDRATRHLALDAFVLFSSTTGAYGNVGQGDYALANAFLDAYAHERAQAVARGECQGRTVSIGWPLWADGGMQVGIERRDGLRALGAGAMPTAQGLQALYEACASGAARVQVLYGTAPAPVTDVVPADAVWQGEASALRPRTLQQLQRLFGAVTKLAAAQIDVTEPLESYGIDSILITQLNTRLTGIFGELSKTLFYEYPTLAELGEYLIREHAAACARWCGMQDSPAQAAAASLVVPSAPLVAPAPRLAAPTVPADAVVPSSRAIAVIGLAGRYPQARDVDAYWDNLRDGRDSIGEIPAERWPIEGFFEPDMERAIASGRSYGKWGGFIDGFAEFDALFFNISPREAMNVDPQERLFLETCWAAMEDAGYTRERFATAHRRRVGVFAGITKTGFDLYGPELWRRGETAAPSTSFGSLANRVSYALNLQGPSMPIDTMCSASLTAIHEACEHLLRDECELAFAGGVNLYLHPANYAMLCGSRMLSASGRCHSFGTGGDGFVPGEGVGAVLLKPLARALADRDPIHGVIRATGINHDGKTNGYTVPNPVAQRDLIAATLAKAGIDARTVSYIEAHGTGTSLGDPIEITGLTQAFARHTADTQFCAIGSVKSNIGHAESAAGIAGLTKVLLQMKHRQLVPSLHAETLNPNIDFSTTPFVVQRTLADWRRPQVTIAGVTVECPRIAGISSFGAGGANAHIIVEEYVAPAEAPFVLTRPAVVVLSGRSEERLQAHAQQLLDAIARRSLGDADLANLAYTLQVGRESMEQRLAFTASTMQELTQKLERYLAGEEVIDDLHRGEVKRNKEALSVFSEDDELHEAIAKWLERGKYAKVLGLWVKGLAFDWARLYPHGTPRIIALPTYPFARELYWFGNLSKTTIADVIAMSPSGAVETQRPAAEERFAGVQRNAGKPSVSLSALSNTTTPRVAVPKPEPEPARRPEPVAATAMQPVPTRAETVEVRPVAAVTTVAAAVVSIESIADSLTESLAKALFIDRKNISADDVFVELGLDSIIGVEWTHVINRTYGLALPATRLYDYPTIRDLTAYVAGELDKRPAPSPAVAESTPPVPTRAAASGPAASPPAVDVPTQDTATSSPPAAQPVAPTPAADAGQGRASAGLREGIAIIGLSARYPHANDADAFWRNIAAGRDCIDDVPRDRWSVDDVYDASGETLGTTYCRAMGAVADVAQFDPQFFGIAPSEAYVMDPQQRLFLQACWECIEDAAIDASRLAGTRCAVFAGCGAGDYGAGPDAASAQGLIGGSSSILAGRISYFLDLKGPCLAIDTACSSSLVAIASACDNLVLGQSDMALAGGVCVLCGPAIHVTTSNAGMLSKAGRCFAFDQRADGFVPAEGVGVVLLKRLGDALRDRDRIHGVIRGWGVNQDGKTNGITAPSVKSQIALERDVYERFGIDPRTITLVEAHGTGTKLGDPIEVEALVAAFDAVRSDAAPAQNSCALGSVKSNIGHALTAAAVASVVKVLLAMRHRKLPPTLHFERLNEHIDLRGTPFYVNDRLRDWNVPANVPRCAAVSSFGFSGTNAHCVIEEAPLPACERVSRPGYLIVLSAKTAPQLREQALRLAAHCERHAVDCADTSYTLLVGRKHFGHRLACVVGDTSELCFTLERWAKRGEAEGVVTGEFEGGVGNDVAIREYGNRSIAESRAEQDPAAYLQRLSAIAELYVQGHALDYAGLFSANQCRRISLPTYPFARERYWFSPSPSAPAHAAPTDEAVVPGPADAPLSGIVDAVMQGTLDVGSAAAQLRRLSDEADAGRGGYDGAPDHAGANGHYFNGKVT
ncbi:SDR family NAD(P)-dependent oxidoreductase [Tahibacter sp.]|uniref:SDR family NAD(P)-dependent oxidoreductase n=1 Tax=Tahibacter sp. TaxID=2056211 RepID=UPI0031BA182D